MSTIAEQIPVGNNEDPLWNGRRLSLSTNKSKKFKVFLKIIDTEGNAPIAIPITRKCTTVSKESKPSEWPTVLTPVRFYRKLTINPQPAHGKVKNKSLKLEDGWLYVFVNGYLWRELRVSQTCHGSYFYDVNLDKEQNEDIRFATGQGDTRILLPFKIENNEMAVEVGFSSVQWSWARIESMGGISPEGKKRKSWFPDEHAVNSKGKTLRAQRLHHVREPDLGNVDNADLFNFKIDQGKKIKSFGLHDYINDARDLSYSYQQSWRDLEDFIADISNPNNEKVHKYAPWFDTAVLANQYFFAEQTDIAAENLSKTPGRYNSQNWTKAKTERDKWKRYLSLADIQTALGVEKRKELRLGIKKAKKALVAYLDDGAGYISHLKSSIDDYCTLPNRTVSLSKASEPHSGLRFMLGNELLARLPDHEYVLDNHLETTPLSQKGLYNKQTNDPGYQLLGKISNDQHTLSNRFFISTSAVTSKPTSSQNTIDDADPVMTAEKLAIVGRRSAQFIGAFVSDFARIAISKQFTSTQDSIATLVSKSNLGMDNLKKISISAEEYLSGKLTGENADKYELLRVVVKDADEKIKASAGKNFDGDKPELKPGLSAELNVINKDGVVVGSTTAEAFNNGKGFSRKYMRKKGKKHQWRKITLEVWVVEKSKGLYALTKGAVDKGLWSKGILPVVGVFEAWNLYKYFDNFRNAKKTGEGLLDAKLKFGSALADFAAISAAIYEGQLAYKHRLVQKATGTQNIAKSTRYIYAIRGARITGFGAGAFSAALSLDAMFQNLYEGDDAAYAHGLMAGGFILVTVSEIVGIAVSFGLLGSGSAAALMAGPIGWIGLAVVLIGAALLAWVFTEDTPLEQWLTNGPFSIKPIQPGRISKETRNGVTYNVFHQDGLTYYFDPETSVLKNVARRTRSYKTHIGSDGTVTWYRKQNPEVIGKIGKPFHPERFQSREQRFAGNDGNSNENDKFTIWKKHPKSCYDFLVNLIYRPTASLKLLRIGSDCDYYYNMELHVHVPNYIEGKTLLFVELWRKKSPKWIRFWDSVELVTGEGSGPRSIQVRKYLSNNRDVKARIWLDMYGDGSVKLPTGDPKLLSAKYDAVSGPGSTKLPAYSMPLNPLEVTPEITYVHTS